MNKYIKLIKNSGLFALANMSSSLISFLLVRFYTELLTTEQYGTIDFIATTSSILIPILTVAIIEAVLRFSMDEYDKPQVLNNGLTVAAVGNLLFWLIGPLILVNTPYAAYTKWMALLIFATSTGGIIAHYVRGTGQVTLFALYGVIKTLTMVTSNIVLLAMLHWKVEGYLLSMVISEFVSALFLVWKARLWKTIRLQIDKKLLHKMLRYALPLMPNALSWWVLNASDKYMIIAFIGLSANGLYAVAHKIPTIINLCNGLFFQAWQLSAVEEANKQDTQHFYTQVFQMLSMFLILTASGIFLFTRVILDFLVAQAYSEVWRYTPFLVLSMVFSAFSSFLGTNYIAMKKTGGALLTALLGALVNVILNLTLIPLYGLNGAAFATMCGFFIMWVSRTMHTRAFVHIQYDGKRFVPALLLLLVQALAICTGWKYMDICNIICLILITLLYRMQILKVYGQLKNVICRQRKNKV